MGWNYLSIPKLQQYNCWSLGMDQQFHPTCYWESDYLTMLGLKLINVSKIGHWRDMIVKIWITSKLIFHCIPIVTENRYWNELPLYGQRKTMIPYGLHGVSNQRSLDYLLHSICRLANKENIKGVYYWPFVRGIHQSMDSLTKAW